MKKIIIVAVVLMLVVIPLAMMAQPKTLAELLGYPAHSKLLIIHGDDMGLSHSTNLAYMKAFPNGDITSGSVMVPCPWFAEIAAFVRENPGLDVGVHLTFTAEWKHYQWDGVSSSDEIPSLLNGNGMMYATVEEVGAKARPDEVEKEMRAQIERAKAYGIEPTHIDNHMGSALFNPELLKVYLKIANEYRLPYLFPSVYTAMLPPETKALMGKNAVLLDNLFMLSPEMITATWSEPYLKAVSQLKPGLNEIIVHLSADDAEMQAIADDHRDYGSLWRKNDWEVMASAEFKQALKENGIILVTWKQIKEAIYPR